MSPRLAQAQPEQPLGLKLSRVTSHTCAPGRPSPRPCCLQRPPHLEGGTAKSFLSFSFTSKKKGKASRSH